MGRITITNRGLAVGLLQAGVSNQEVGLHCSLFLANRLPELIDYLSRVRKPAFYICENIGAD